MRVFLMRHADAKSESEDPSRGLSIKGITEARDMAAYLARAGIKASLIVHSGKKRAFQTAEVLADYIKPLRGLSEGQSLYPIDAPEVWAKKLNETGEDIFLVGHLPHMGRLASLLLSGDAEKEIIYFETAGVACLERLRDGWTLRWMLIPGMLA